MGGNNVFYEKHKNILEPIDGSMNSPQSLKDKETLQKSYKKHLSKEGLLDSQGLGMYYIKPLGELLLREIGLVDDVE